MRRHKAGRGAQHLAATAGAIITVVTRGAEARLFVALDLPADLCAQLAGWARSAAASVRVPARAGARGHVAATGGRVADFSTTRRRPAPAVARGPLRLLESDTLHVTLCFLGNRPVGEIEAIGAAVAAACAEAPPVGALALGAPLWLPPRHPRALAVELHDTPDRALEALHVAVADALAATCDFGPDTAPSAGRSPGGRARHRRFRPHVTVARLRPADAPRERDLPATPALSFLPGLVTLNRSWLTPTQAVYEQLTTCALATPAAD